MSSHHLSCVKSVFTISGADGLIYFPISAILSVIIELDNHYRYLTGAYLAVTFAIWWTLGNIEERVVPFRMVCAAVFIGGVGRVVSIATVGMPESSEYIVGAVIELILVPLLLLWQLRLRQKAGVA
ncbi:MAG: DUF4345 domain-containing protein [Chloroflexota bacterium]